MPFNIELSTIPNGVSIKVQVVKNMINIYFNGPTIESVKARGRWVHLSEHFLNTMPEYNRDMPGISNPSHIKKNHTNEGEITVYHFHQEFKSEITPELFSLYLAKFYEQQSKHGDEYEFFVNNSEIAYFNEAYKSYYAEYKGSSTEMLYEEATRLTEKEQIEYNKAVVNEKNAQDSRGPDLTALPVTNLAALLVASMLSGRHPVFGDSPLRVVAVPPDEEEFVNDCLTM